MKKRFLILTVCLVCAALLAGCSCQHEWVEASCTAAKVCSKCDETEGEPLGHTWVEATCAAPKTCSVCGETEGEALEHTWEEASCAAPKTCAVCGATEGEALAHTWAGTATYQSPDICTVCGAEGEMLASYFDENGLAVNVTADVEADYITSTYQKPDLDTTGKLVASNFRVFESDDSHKAKDGYEWRAVDFTATFSDGNSGLYGTNFTCCRADFYTNQEVKEAGDKAETFTVNYNGTEFDCVCKFENVGWELTDSSNIFHVSCYVQVPAGYDGVVLAFYHSSIDVKGMHLHEIEDENMLLYRLA